MKARPIESKMPTVKLERLKNMIASLEKNRTIADETELSFEYIVGSLYPTLYDNIITEFNRQYINGYMQGREDMKNELERIS